MFHAIRPEVLDHIDEATRAFIGALLTTVAFLQFDRIKRLAV
jgi:hypothetical protein